MWSDCLLDLGTDFLVGDMVFVNKDLSTIANQINVIFKRREVCVLISFGDCLLLIPKPDVVMKWSCRGSSVRILEHVLSGPRRLG